MVRMLIRAVIFFGAAAVGLALAAWWVPGVRISVPGFLVAVLVFTVVQSLLTPIAMKIAHRYSPTLVGGMGLVSTALALWVASSFQGGVILETPQAWLLGTLVVWLVTALGWWLLPLWLLKEKATGRRSG